MPSGKKVAGFFLRPRLPFLMLRRSVEATQDTASESRDLIRNLSRETREDAPARPPRQAWQQMVNDLLRAADGDIEQVDNALRLQYRQRAVHAAIYGGLAMGGAVWAIMSPTPIDLLAGGVLCMSATLFYLIQAFNMHRIRHRSLIGLREYSAAVKRAPSELALLPLPDDWTSLTQQTNDQ